MRTMRRASGTGAAADERGGGTVSNQKIEVIAHCDAFGALRPLRFRFEDEHHGLRAASVTEIVSEREIRYVGIETLQYICKAILNGAERMFELRYTVRSHSWTLYRVIY